MSDPIVTSTAPTDNTAPPTAANTPTTPADKTVPPMVAATVEPSQAAFPIHRSWKIALVVAVIMVLLALLGVGLSTAAGAKSTTAYIYWVSLVPLYGALCVWCAWAHLGVGHKFTMALVWRQVWHWLGIGIALGLDFMIRQTGEESSMGAGMVALLVLALGCYLAGIHFEWLFILVGALLSATLFVVAQAEQYMWLIFVVGMVAIALMLALAWYARATRPRQVPVA
jgi:hypothetical protein